MENPMASPSTSSAVPVMEDVPMNQSRHHNNNRRRRPHRSVSQIDAVQSQNGVWGASSNLVNAIVGAGIIGIPYAIDQSGLVVGVLLLGLVAYFTDKSLRMIVNLASFHPLLHNLGVLTFEDLLSIPFGKRGRNFVLTSMFVLALGAMTAYLLIVKDTVPTILGLGNTFVERELVMFLSTFFIVVPLSMMRDISQLAFTSFLSVTADLVLVVIVVVYAPVRVNVQDHGGIGTVLKNAWFNKNLFIGLGVLSTALACQHSAFLISGSLKNKTPSRWATVTRRSLIIASLMSMALGIFGYLGYLEQTQGDILNNFEPRSVAVNAGRALLAVTMYLTYPMESFVARHVIVQLLYNGNMDNASVGPDGEPVAERKFWGCLGRREKVTIGLYFLALIPALIVDDLGPVLSLTGSLGASCIAYIAPGLAYMGVNGGDFLDWVSGHSNTSDDNERKNDQDNPEVELPVVGDATATMVTVSEQQQNRWTDDGNSGDSRRRKPWWWCLVGMPLWVALATAGERGTREFLADFGGVSEEEEEEEINNNPDNDDNGVAASMDEGLYIVVPNHRDFYISIILIVFGVVAAVCGVLSNIYVQVNSIFFNPK